MTKAPIGPKQRKLMGRRHNHAPCPSRNAAHLSFQRVETEIAMTGGREWRFTLHELVPRTRYRGRMPRWDVPALVREALAGSTEALDTLEKRTLHWPIARARPKL